MNPPKPDAAVVGGKGCVLYNILRAYFRIRIRPVAANEQVEIAIEIVVGEHGPFRAMIVITCAKFKNVNVRA